MVIITSDIIFAFFIEPSVKSKNYAKSVDLSQVYYNGMRTFIKLFLCASLFDFDTTRVRFVGKISLILNFVTDSLYVLTQQSSAHCAKTSIFRDTYA